jgi:hypothetical protein
MNEMTELNQTQYFEIKINGHLSYQRSKSFVGLQVAHLANGETLISGEIKDQAQLFGILVRIRDMGIPLLSVNFLQSKSSQTKGDSK